MDKNFNFDKYKEYLQIVGSLSRLFSSSQTPFIQYRTVEILYSMVSGAQNIANEDSSFDAITPEGIPVGIKTFIANKSTKQKKEKIAEFSQENINLIKDLDYEKTVAEVAKWRNLRILSDAKQKDLSISNAIYHCLIRRPGEVFIHEESYPLIDEANIFPVSSCGKQIDKFTGLHFSDGQNVYTFAKSKSTLLKKFDFSKGINSAPVPIEILENPIKALKGLLKQKTDFWTPDKFYIHEQSSSLIAGKNYIVLPLYSTKNIKQKKVYERSGINQWNARGRPRAFGEVYIPIPALIHGNKFTKDFLPDMSIKFKLTLPNAKTLLAKVCQEGGKALMSDPNALLGEYLFSVIDAAGEHQRTRQPFAYKDLLQIGKDSVVIYKIAKLEYKLEFARIGAHEEFLEELSLL